MARNWASETDFVGMRGIAQRGTGLMYGPISPLYWFHSKRTGRCQTRANARGDKSNACWMHAQMALGSGCAPWHCRCP